VSEHHGGDSRAVITAVKANAAVACAKLIGFILSGSAALMAEAVHSLADTANQALLWVGLKRAEKKADAEHHFGYGQERYFWNLVSAITIFFLGCVYTVMHAAQGIIESHHHPEIGIIPIGIVIFSLLAEGNSFRVAAIEFLKQAEEENLTWKQYIKETRDPTTLAVLIEDSAAVFGLLIAGAGMGITWATGSAIFDGLAAIIIGLLMGGLAAFLASINKKYLLNYADDDIDIITETAWNNNNKVQKVHEVCSIVLSPEETLVMAEVELREEELFVNMDKSEIAQAIRFMKRLDAVKVELEEEIRQKDDSAKRIYLEFTAPSEQNINKNE